MPLWFICDILTNDKFQNLFKNGNKSLKQESKEVFRLNTSYKEWLTELGS